MKSLIAIQYPELSGLGATYITDPGYRNDQTAPPPPGVVAPSAVTDTAVTPTSTVITPEEALAQARRYTFLSTIHGGPDYGARSGERNDFFWRDVGLSDLGLDLMKTIVESVKKSAPAAFKPVQGSALIPQSLKTSGAFSLPSWIPRISVPKPLQGALTTVAKKAIDDVKKAKAASNTGLANQTVSGDYPGPSNSNMTPWVLGGVAALLIASVYVASKRSK